MFILMLMYVLRLKSKRRVKRRLAAPNDAFNTIVDLLTLSKPLAADVDLMPIQIHKEKFIIILLQ